MQQLKTYKHNVEWVGFDGRKKAKGIDFIITKTSIVENYEHYERFENFRNELLETYKNLDNNLSSKDALALLDIGLLVIKLAYADIDFENDIVDKSEEAVKRFQSSLAYEALMTQILDDPPVLLEIMNRIGELIPADEATRTEIDRLRQEYIEKTTIQNGDKHGQDAVVETAEEKRIRQLREELQVLEGGK